MAVEILILSGARQGERLVLDGKELRVGSDPGCEVFFDPERDRAIQGRSALLRLQEDGWYIHCAGGEVVVNQQPVAGWTRVRSGDVVRMSESGPDFSFGIVLGAAASAGGVVPTPVRLPESFCHQETPPHCNVGALGNGMNFSEVAPMAESCSPAAIPRVIGGDRRWALRAIGGVALVIVALLLGRSLLSPPTVVVEVRQSSPSPGPPDRAMRDGGGQKADEEKATEETGNGKQETKAKRPASGLGAQLEKAVFLLQIEKAGHWWPYATCVAISDDTLLTTAREAAQLARWQVDSGFKVWVTRQADGFKEQVQDIRVNGVFASLAERPGDWIYVDSGLLTVGGKLPQVAALASREELDALEAGVPVTCFGFTHEGEEITRFDSFKPSLATGKIKWITADRGLPGRPRLLHVKAEIPQNAYGSPVVNAEGKLIGLYGEAAPPADKAASSGAELKNMHYVTVVYPETLNLWLRDRDAKMWPPAAASPTTQKTQDHP